MTDFADLLSRLTVTGPLPAAPPDAEPLGAAWLARRRHGLDLAAGWNGDQLDLNCGCGSLVVGLEDRSADYTMRAQGQGYVDRLAGKPESAGRGAAVATGG